MYSAPFGFIGESGVVFLRTTLDFVSDNLRFPSCRKHYYFCFGRVLVSLDFLLFVLPDTYGGWGILDVEVQAVRVQTQNLNVMDTPGPVVDSLFKVCEWAPRVSVERFTPRTTRLLGIY